MILRSLFFVLVMVPYLILGIPIQFLITRLGLKCWQVVPMGFHRLACSFLGLEVKVVGTPERARPTLLVSNHIGWTDIIAVGSATHVTFVAKSEIARWPVVSLMASLQKTIYVDRTRRSDARRTSNEMAARMADGGTVLLFAEGQSDTGTHVLPFRSALIGAAQHAMVAAGAQNVVIQPLTIAYTRLQGMPVTRTERGQIGWAKSKTFRANIRNILSGGTRQVVLSFGAPIPLGESDDRKAITRKVEAQVRAALVALNRGTPLTSTPLSEREPLASDPV